MSAAARRSGRPAKPRRPSPVLALALIELRLVFRRPGLAAVALLLPFVLVGMTYVGERPDTPERWGATLGAHTVIALLLTVYMNTAMVLVSRREGLVFKRLRTSELTSAGLLLSVLLPILVLGSAQLAVMFGINLATGAPAPQRPELVAAAVLLGLPLALALGAMMAALTSTTERVQFTVSPILLGAAVGSQIVTGPFEEVLLWSALAFPLVSVVDLVHKGWAGPGAGVAALPIDAGVVSAALLLPLLWTGAAVLLTVRKWRWEQRS